MARVTVTVFTGGVFTVSRSVPVLPSLVAVMVVVHGVSVVIIPLASLLATVGVLDVHVTTRPVSGAPVAEKRRALARTSRCGSVIPVENSTWTLSTGASSTVIADAACLPSLVAVIVTGPPGATPVTT